MDMQNITSVRKSDVCVNTIKRILSQRPTDCLGVRLLANLNDHENYILVSYWRDRNSMLMGTVLLHEQIMKAVEGFATASRMDAYEIKHEV